MSTSYLLVGLQRAQSAPVCCGPTKLCVHRKSAAFVKPDILGPLEGQEDEFHLPTNQPVDVFVVAVFDILTLEDQVALEVLCVT